MPERGLLASPGGRRAGAFRGTATFDADGQCTGVLKFFAGPLPPW
jgi:hypothetical protein